MTAPAQTATPERLALAFVEMLREYLTADEWRTMRERNATPDYAGDVCASHDFMDANMAMLDAWNVATGLSAIDANDEAQTALWNAAWAIAKRDHLTAPGA